jgi:prefoldin subunit 5
MTTPPETALVRELRARVQELEHQNADLTRQVADLERHNKELREAVAALLVSDPPPSQASQKQERRL